MAVLRKFGRHMAKSNIFLPINVPYLLRFINNKNLFIGNSIIKYFEGY
jgi:hypothetical protein